MSYKHSVCYVVLDQNGNIVSDVSNDFNLINEHCKWLRTYEKNAEYYVRSMHFIENIEKK